jgi:hypothetical protein
MFTKIKSFEKFINEDWSAFSPGSVAVPGDAYKDVANSRNYRPRLTQLPVVVDALYDTNDLYTYLDSLAHEEEFGKVLQTNHKDPKKIVKHIKKRIHEELSHKAKSST